VVAAGAWCLALYEVAALSRRSEAVRWRARLLFLFARRVGSGAWLLVAFAVRGPRFQRVGGFLAHGLLELWLVGAGARVSLHLALLSGNSRLVIQLQSNLEGRAFMGDHAWDVVSAGRRCL